MTKSISTTYRPDWVNRATRVALDEKVLFKPRRQQNFEGLVKDVSQSGAYLVSTQKLSVGSEVVVYLPLPLGAKKKLCIVSGVVTRNDSDPKISYQGYGIRFDSDLSCTSQEGLEDYVSLKTDGVLPNRATSSSEEVTRPARRVIEKTPPAARLAFHEKSVPQRKVSAKEHMNHALKRQRDRAQKAKGKRTSLPKRKVLAAMVLVGLFGVGFSVLRSSIQNHRLVSSISEVVPLIHVKIADEKLTAQVKADWIKETRPSIKLAQFQELAKQLVARKVHEAVFVDKTGRRVAVMLKNRTNRNEPMVQFLGAMSTDKI